MSTKMNWLQAVYHFHDAFGQRIGYKPKQPPPDDLVLRANLHAEEYIELCEAMGNGDVPEVADALADLIYVLLGTAVSYGINLEPIFWEVHRTNMNKQAGDKRADGKITKPPGWKPPRIAEMLATQGPLMCNCGICRYSEEM